MYLIYLFFFFDILKISEIGLRVQIITEYNVHNSILKTKILGGNINFTNISLINKFISNYFESSCHQLFILGDLKAYDFVWN